jgi:hypothetical protein
MASGTAKVMVASWTDRQPRAMNSRSRFFDRKSAARNSSPTAIDRWPRFLDRESSAAAEVRSPAAGDTMRAESEMEIVEFR